MKVDELHPIFRECCAKADIRYAISEPFVQQGFWNATNGVILVRCPADGLPDTEGDRRIPTFLPIERLDTGVIVIPDLGPEPAPSCKVCDGSGVDECPECGHERECAACDGAKYEGDEYDRVMLGNWPFKKCFLRIIQRHVAVFFVPPFREYGKKPAYFTLGDGIEGLLAPMTKPA